MAESHRRAKSGGCALSVLSFLICQLNNKDSKDLKEGRAQGTLNGDVNAGQEYPLCTVTGGTMTFCVKSWRIWG